ncbi:MAG: aspartate aminotransferase family protein [Armatimonadetes bacterium]|nr:aspartate aminotransferase family protein [Armatimonadota bacterium]
MREQSRAVFERNRRYIPGGVVSLNRKVQPEIAFVRAKGSRLWDADGNEYIDYHAAFAPFLLGHNDPEVNDAVVRALAADQSLMGTGATPWEGRLSELIVESVPSVEKVQFTNTGSEATYHAIRLSRAFTGKSDIIVMQGGYNGWHNEVACNVMTPLEAVGPRVSPGEYDYHPLSAGVPADAGAKVHIVNFNDLDSIAYVLDRHPVACILLEPILQNVGVVRPRPGYLQGIREFCARYGAVLAFDEVKTGFRHALGGYQGLCGVMPDLSVFGKALANGYPIGAIGGRADIMDLFDDPDPSRRVLIAGTYNAHPAPVAAAIATLEKLKADPGIYSRLEAMGQQMESGLQAVFAEAGVEAAVARQSSAFCAYFMDHAPRDWHDIARHHDFKFDIKYRQALISQGVYHFPLPTKQGSISAAHTEEDITQTLGITRKILREMKKAG